MINDNESNCWPLGLLAIIGFFGVVFVLTQPNGRAKPVQPSTTMTNGKLVFQERGKWAVFVDEKQAPLLLMVTNVDLVIGKNYSVEHLTIPYPRIGGMYYSWIKERNEN